MNSVRGGVVTTLLLLVLSAPAWACTAEVDRPPAPAASTPPPTAAAAPTVNPTPTPTAAETAAGTATLQETPTPVVATATPEPTLLTIAGTDGEGVSVRDACDDARRISAPGRGIAEGTTVQLIESGEGDCADWMLVQVPDGRESWVRSRYLAASPQAPSASRTATATPQLTPAAAPTQTPTVTPQPTPAATATRTPTATPQPTPATAPQPYSPPTRLEIVVAPVPADIPGYDRDEWRHWIDTDSDCQDTRQEVLIAESRTAVSYASSRECRAQSGFWVGPYTGSTLSDPGGLDVDHMVPLANAHRSGGWAWDSARKAQYANDLGYENHLIAVQSSANRSKGSRGPDQWRPPKQDYWCEYAVDWIVIKSSWNLTATEQEAAALQVMLDTCATSPTLTIRHAPSAAPAPTPTATATPEPTATPGLEAFHCHCRRVINAGTRCDQRYTTQGGPGYCHTAETHGAFNTWPPPH